MKTVDLALATYLYALGFVPNIEGDGKQKTFVFTGSENFETMKANFLHYKANDIDCRTYFEALSSLKSLLYA